MTQPQSTGILLYDQARAALSACLDTDDVLEVKARADAVREYARQAQNRTLEIDAAEIRIRAERRLGELLKKTPKHEGGRPSQTPNNESGVSTLDDQGIDYRLSSRSQKLADISEPEFEEQVVDWREEREHGGRVTTTLKPVHVAQNSGNNEWYTPPHIIEAARKVMGGIISLDPASSDKANETVGAPTHYTVEDDGLSREWRGRVWLNPPYQRGLVDKFVTHLMSSPHVTQAVVLVNNGTETDWAQRLLAAATAVCFPKGRIRYVAEDGETKMTPLQGQMIVGLGVDAVKFRAVFETIGAVR